MRILPKVCAVLFATFLALLLAPCVQGQSMPRSVRIEPQWLFDSITVHSGLARVEGMACVPQWRMDGDTLVIERLGYGRGVVKADSVNIFTSRGVAPCGTCPSFHWHVRLVWHGVLDSVWYRTPSEVDHETAKAAGAPWHALGIAGSRLMTVYDADSIGFQPGRRGVLGGCS